MLFFFSAVSSVTSEAINCFMVKFIFKWYIYFYSERYFELTFDSVFIFNFFEFLVRINIRFLKKSMKMLLICWTLFRSLLRLIKKNQQKRISQLDIDPHTWFISCKYRMQDSKPAFLDLTEDGAVGNTACKPQYTMTFLVNI